MPTVKLPKVATKSLRARKATSDIKLEEPSLSSTPSSALVDNDGINGAYLKHVMDDVNTIKGEWPTIAELDPLPVADNSGFLGLFGFGPPFMSAVFDARVQDKDFELSTFINVFWQDMYRSLLISMVPLYRERVIEYARNHLLSPNVLKHSIYLNTDFSSGEDLPRGSIMRLSPDVPVHALLFRVAEVIRAADSTPSVKQAWLRVLLSVPVVFVKRPDFDSQYAEVNSLREDILGTGEAVAETTRQTCFNISGFKKIKEEANHGHVLSAQTIATFYLERIRLSQTNKHMAKKSSVDTCITLVDRFYGIPGVDTIVRSSEAHVGQESFWNSLYRNQEIVYRAQKPDRILWCVNCLDDGHKSGKYQHDEVSVPMLKTGSRSVTDVMLTSKALKEHLLGPWLDTMGFPTHIKDKCREIFASHSSWRTLWQPLVSHSDDPSVQLVVDTTWIFQWPRVGKDLLAFLEATIYMPSAHEEWQYRNAVKNNTPPAEILTQKPWCDTIVALKDKLRSTGFILATAAGSGGGTQSGGDDRKRKVHMSKSIPKAT